MAMTGKTFDHEKLLERLCGGEFDQASAGQSELQVESIVQATNWVKPPLYALVIGIDEYETIPPLVAAAPDAIEFKKFLTIDLLVPEDQITLLLNKDATRDGIIKAFQKIANDKRIKKDNPIVIYYAGRGSLVDSPADHSRGGSRVQCIVPQDISKATGIVAIPDFTIGALLTLIANAKGDNIVMITDCCHSSGGLHDHRDSRFIARSQLPELPPDLDVDVIAAATKGTRALIEPGGLLTASMTSLALLAACSHGEAAFENSAEGYGYFTRALLKLLRSIKVDKSTYKECIQRLPPLQTRQTQKPVCEGKNVNHRFFDAKVLDPKSQFIPVKTEGKGKALFLQAGLAEGVTTGCTFAIYSDCVIGSNNPALGSLTVIECSPFRSLLTPFDGAANFSVPTIAYGWQTGYGNDQALGVYITEGFVNAVKPDPKWGRAFSGQASTLLRLTTADLAQLVVGINSCGEATFTISNPSAVAYGIQELPVAVEPTADAVIPVLRAAARWNFHLNRVPSARPFQKSVQVEFYKLEFGTDYDDQGYRILNPIEENLIKGGEVDLVLGDGTKKDPYGLKITNSSGRDLYAYPFYFGVPTQHISTSFNRFAKLTKADALLPRGTPLTLGYGSGGRYPMMFKLDPGCDLDVGVLKILITTDRANFDSIKQNSPFEGTRGDMLDQEVKSSLIRQPLWDVINLTVVQRRKPKPTK